MGAGKEAGTGRRSLEGIVGLSSLYAYVFSMVVSNALTAMPIFGGALFMCGRVAAVFFSTYTGTVRYFLPQKSRRWGTALLCVMLLCNLLLMVVFPITLSDTRVWILFALILTMTMRDFSCRRLMLLSVSRGMPPKRFALTLTVFHLIPAGVIAGLLLVNLPMVQGWQLLGGYLLCSVLELYSQLKEREEQRLMTRPGTVEQAQRLRESMDRANAFRSYERLSNDILVAMQLTLILVYTCLAVTSEQVLYYMVLSVLCTLAARETAEFFLRRMEHKREPDPTNMMLVGLFLWLYGLVLFSQMLREGAMVLTNVYICLGLCSAGSAVCVTAMARMERTMMGVARFTSGGEAAGYRQLRTAGRELASLVGQMLALVLLTVLCFVTGKNLPRDMAQLSASFQPLMAIPALLTVLGALLAVFRFPINQRYMDKLSRFLKLKDMGSENPALEKQLERVVIQRHRQPFFVNVIKAVLRPFFRHTLQGTENIHQDESNPIVFLCNHGEFYGPVVTELFIPAPLRPWTISEITVNKDEVSEYVYKYTIKRQKWLLECLKWPIARLIGPLSVWVMDQLETIPVYRNHPRELMSTFRMSVEAMQAGDNLLIFPENPNAVAEEHGYERSGLGELFSGFAMLAPIYYNKTGKCCRFLPAYAHKDRRTLTFGEEIVFDPDNAPNEERDRIVESVKKAMLSIAEQEERLYQAELAEKKKRIGNKKA